WVTLYETLGGFALSILVGVPLAVLIVYSPVLKSALYPLIVLAQSVPKIAVAPVLLLILGHGEIPKVIVAFLVAFFPVVVDFSPGRWRWSSGSSARGSPPRARIRRHA